MGKGRIALVAAAVLLMAAGDQATQWSSSIPLVSVGTNVSTSCMTRTDAHGNVMFLSDCPPDMMRAISEQARLEAPASRADVEELMARIDALRSDLLSHR